MESAGNYWGEFRTHWRALLAATMGLGFGVGVNAYIMAMFAPVLLAEFGWSRAELALLGTLALTLLITSPIVGRLADRFGARPIAAIGIFTLPLTFIALARQDGSIGTFFAIAAVQSILGAMTTAPIFCRLAAERFVAARGLAFSIVTTGPPLAGAFLSPFIGAMIGSQGWRTSYLIVGGITFAFGLIALMLMPRGGPKTEVSKRKHSAADYRELFSTRAFWVLFVGMVLVNLPQSLASTQLKVMLADSGAQADFATWLVSAYAVGVIIGRFICGYALDRLPPQRVAAVALSLPALGLIALASPFDAPPLLAVSVALIGLAQGAEGDIAAYLVGRHFPLRMFSLTLGFVGSAITAGIAGGSYLLSQTLARFDSFAPFLWLCAGATILGALLFLLLGAGKVQGEDA